MKRISIITLFICFACDTPTDTGSDGNGGSGNGDTAEYEDLTVENLSIEFESCYGSDLENRTYTLSDESFIGKSIVIQFVTPW